MPEPKLNIIERTKEQQEAVERELLIRGSLWPCFPILRQYVFTRSEFEEAKQARNLIDAHRTKIQTLWKEH